MLRFDYTIGDLKSLIYHEGQHIELRKQGITAGFGNPEAHFNLYISQFEHETWVNTSEDFKNKMYDNAKELIKDFIYYSSMGVEKGSAQDLKNKATAKEMTQKLEKAKSNAEK